MRVPARKKETILSLVHVGLTLVLHQFCSSSVVLVLSSVLVFQLLKLNKNVKG